MFQANVAKAVAEYGILVVASATLVVSFGVLLHHVIGRLDKEIKHRAKDIELQAQSVMTLAAMQKNQEHQQDQHREIREKLDRLLDRKNTDG